MLIKQRYKFIKKLNQIAIHQMSILVKDKKQYLWYGSKAIENGCHEK